MLKYVATKIPLRLAFSFCPETHGRDGIYFVADALGGLFSYFSPKQVDDPSKSGRAKKLWR